MRRAVQWIEVLFPACGDGYQPATPYLETSVTTITACAVCRRPVTTVETHTGNIKFKCDQCGTYLMSWEANEDNVFEDFTERSRANVSAWLSRNPIARITLDKIEQLRSLKEPSVLQRLDLMLQQLANGVSRVNEQVDLTIRMVSATWSIDDSDARGLLRLLEQQGKVQREVGAYTVTATGWQHLHTLSSDSTNSNQCFVAMCYNDQMFDVYSRALGVAIGAAGYDAFIVSERDHNGKIDDLMVAEIRKSKFVVADFTEQRGGVYYEAGFAQGLGKEVIWTCREDQVKELHFDIRQYNCVLWKLDNLADFTSRLRLRIERVLGRGRNLP